MSFSEAPFSFLKTTSPNTQIKNAGILVTCSFNSAPVFNCIDMAPSLAATTFLFEVLCLP
jgi:hypothetical protein